MTDFEIRRVTLCDSRGDGKVIYTVTIPRWLTIDLWVHEFSEYTLYELIREEYPTHSYMLWQYAAWINHLVFTSVLNGKSIEPDEYSKVLQHYVFRPRNTSRSDDSHPSLSEVKVCEEEEEVVT